MSRQCKQIRARNYEDSGIVIVSCGRARVRVAWRMCKRARARALPAHLSTDTHVHTCIYITESAHEHIQVLLKREIASALHLKVTYVPTSRFSSRIAERKRHASRARFQRERKGALRNSSLVYENSRSLLITRRSKPPGLSHACGGMIGNNIKLSEIHRTRITDR